MKCFMLWGFGTYDYFKYRQKVASFSYSLFHSLSHTAKCQCTIRHEQSRPDRDSYITINYDNIGENYMYNFEKQSSIDSMGAPYDYDSVMHYSSRHFTSNGKDTITANESKAEIGQRKGISAGDKLQVRLMYQCSSGPRNYAAYQANKCTEDCKCGAFMRGCKGKGNSVCKGNLQCEGNVCVVPE